MTLILGVSVICHRGEHLESLLRFFVVGFLRFSSCSSLAESNLFGVVLSSVTSTKQGEHCFRQDPVSIPCGVGFH